MTNETSGVAWVTTETDNTHETLHDTYRCVHGRTSAYRLSNDAQSLDLAMQAAAAKHGEKYGCACVYRLLTVTRATWHPEGT